MKRSLSSENLEFQQDLKRRRLTEFESLCCDLSTVYNDQFDLKSLPPPILGKDLWEWYQTGQFESPPIILSKFHINSLLSLLPQKDIVLFRQFDLNHPSYHSLSDHSAEDFKSPFIQIEKFNEHVPKSHVFNSCFGFWLKNKGPTYPDDPYLFYALLNIRDARFDFSHNFKNDIALSLLRKSHFSRCNQSFEIHYFSKQKKSASLDFDFPSNHNFLRKLDFFKQKIRFSNSPTVYEDPKSVWGKIKSIFQIYFFST